MPTIRSTTRSCVLSWGRAWSYLQCSLPLAAAAPALPQCHPPQEALSHLPTQAEWGFEHAAVLRFGGLALNPLPCHKQQAHRGRAVSCPLMWNPWLDQVSRWGLNKLAKPEWRMRSPYKRRTFKKCSLREWEGNGNHSSILAWRILWTEKPGGLQSRESQRVKHD